MIVPPNPDTDPALLAPRRWRPRRYCGPLSWFTFCCCDPFGCYFGWTIAWCPLDHRDVDPAQPAAADVPEEKYCGALSVLIGVCCCPLGLIAACFPVDRRQNVQAMVFQAGQLNDHQPHAAGQTPGAELRADLSSSATAAAANAGGFPRKSIVLPGVPTRHSRQSHV